MNLTHFRFETDADGIALATWDMPDRSMNVITQEVMSEIDAIIEKVAGDAAIKGCVIASGKEAFSGGADLTMLQGLGAEYARLAKEKGEEAAMRFFVEAVGRLSLLYRKLETCGKPFVAAIHGACMGGAFELALACHARLVSDDEKTRVGLPEIKVGLFPGAGGTQRVARLMPTGDALQMLFKGEQIKPYPAKSMGLVHAVVKRDELVAKAKEALKAGQVPAKQPWDMDGYKLPSGRVYSPAGFQTWPAAAGIYRRETQDNYPAAKAVMQAVYEGLQLPMDLALRVEYQLFAKILRSPVASAMIRTLFLSMQEINKGARRPKSIPPSTLKTVGVIGAGFMGAGIAYVSALAGMQVVLIDRDMAAAEKGKDYSNSVMTAQINKGRAKTADRDAVLARITPAADYALLKDCDLVIEAVFEDRSIKADVIAKAEAAMGEDAVFASNTSTLPISSLAESSKRSGNFIGIHFFSPVEKMMLVEIILGAKTGDKALAVALDYVRAIKKTAIVVNDGRGFFVNRLVNNYILESHLMLMEGVPPAMIENAAKMVGMPVGPLALNDEVAIDLAWKIVKAAKADLGAQAVSPAQEKLLEAMVVTHERLGRKNRKGFYDYPENGPKRLWPGLAGIVGKRLNPDTLDIGELKNRFLAVMALEAARTVEEGIVVDPREADIGSILGFGFAPYTGGALSYIDGMGTKAFVALCEALAAKHGPRFNPNALLVEMARTNERFYIRMAGQKAA